MAFAFLLASSAVACSGARTLPDGTRVTVFVLSDRGYEAWEADTEEGVRRDMVGQFQEENLIQLLRKTRYDATLLQNRAEYIPGPGKYLLEVAILDYRLGVRRTVVNRYRLYGQTGDLLLEWRDEAGSVKGWKTSVIVLNQHAVEKVRAKLEAERPR